MRPSDDSPAPPYGAHVYRHAAAALASLRAMGRLVLGTLYPPHCLACTRSTEAMDGLCGACWRGLSLITRPYCDRLGTPFVQDLGAGLLSAEAIAHPPVFGRARAAALFDDGTARRLVHRLKYGDRPEVARLMGGLMARAAADLTGGRPTLVPMPLHRGRLWRRQYNQSALLADAMSRVLGLPVDHRLLHRVKPTVQQVGLSRPQRERNVQGAFAVPDGTVAAGREILLVDDVLTTGSTANAAARALLRAGAARVDLVVFARVAGEAAVTI